MADEGMSGHDALIIQKFDKVLHDRSAFSCGFTPIDNFLKSSLSDHIKLGIVTAYMATASDDTAVLAFYTLGAMAVRADLGPRKWSRSGVPDMPVIYIRAVAVDGTCQGRGIGTALVIHALEKCIHISEEIGAVAVTLDVLEDAHFERRMAFYQNLGFRLLNDPDNPHRVFIPMADVRKSLRA